MSSNDNITDDFETEETAATTTTVSSPPLNEGGESQLFASARREAEFHSLFRSLPATERLIDNFSCALNREILAHGRMYLGESHVCFNANILGWITNLVIPIREIVSIEKRVTAFVIPNAIQISTLHHRYFFTSFLGRDEVWQKIVLFWRNSLAADPLPTVELLKRRALFVDSFLGDGKVEDIFSDSIKIDRLSDGGGSVRNLPLIPQFAPPPPAAAATRLTLGRPICGCSNHYQRGIVEETVMHNAGMTELKELLFGDASPFMLQFYQHIQYAGIVNGLGSVNYWIDSTFAQAKWSKTSLGRPEMREFKAGIPLPRLLIRDSLARATFTERVLLEEIHSRHIVECLVELEGVPGGKCEFCWRVCLTQKQDCLYLSVSADAMAPKNSWFRESIRQALLAQIQSYWVALMERLSEHFKDGSCTQRRRRSLRWSTFDEAQYFDINAFFQSMRVVLPLLLIFLAIYTVHQRSRQPALSFEDSAERQRRLKVLKTDLKALIASPRDDDKSIRGASLSDPLDRLIKRLDRLEKLSHQLNLEEEFKNQ